MGSVHCTRRFFGRRAGRHTRWTVCYGLFVFKRVTTLSDLPRHGFARRTTRIRWHRRRLCATRARIRVCSSSCCAGVVFFKAGCLPSVCRHFRYQNGTQRHSSREEAYRRWRPLFSLWCGSNGGLEHHPHSTIRRKQYEFANISRSSIIFCLG